MEELDTPLMPGEIRAEAIKPEQEPTPEPAKPQPVTPKGKKPNKSKLIIIVLILVILAGGGYFGYTTFINYQADRDYQMAQYGALTTQAQIMQGVMTCEPLPLTMENITVTLYALECSQQQAAQTS